MRSASAICIFLAAALAPFASAALHKDGVCFDDKGGANVYNEAATIASCGNYQVRNTGGEWWDTCPDCEMVSFPMQLLVLIEWNLTPSLESHWQLECLPLRGRAYRRGRADALLRKREWCEWVNGKLEAVVLHITRGTYKVDQFNMLCERPV